MAAKTKTPKIKKHLLRERFVAPKNGDNIGVFDTETTGLSNDDRIVEFAIQIYKFVDGTLELIEELDQYINPGFLMSQSVIDVHGITNEFLLDKPLEAEAILNIKKALDKCQFFCGHNVSFDIRFVSNMYERTLGIKFEPDENRVLDTRDAAREIIDPSKIPEDKTKYKLINCAKVYGIEEDRFHLACNDVTVTAKLLEYLMAEYRDIKKEIGCKPRVKNVNRWAPSHKLQMLYIYTDCGTFWFNQFYHTWGEKEAFRPVDTEALKDAVLEFTGCSNLDELAKYQKDKK